MKNRVLRFSELLIQADLSIKCEVYIASKFAVRIRLMPGEGLHNAGPSYRGAVVQLVFRRSKLKKLATLYRRCLVVFLSLALCFQLLAEKEFSQSRNNQNFRPGVEEASFCKINCHHRSKIQSKSLKQTDQI